MTAWKLYGIMSSSLLLIGLISTGLGMYILVLNMRNSHNSCSAMMISNTFECFEDEDGIKIDWTLIIKLLKILSVVLIIFTIFFFICFGCFLVLDDSASLVPQTVTLSSEGGANETYPDSMGEYQLAEEEIGGYNWYRHKNREDRFLMYNSLGNIKY